LHECRCFKKTFKQAMNSPPSPCRLSMGVLDNGMDSHPLYNGFAMSHDGVIKNHIKQKRMSPI